MTQVMRLENKTAQELIVKIGGTAKFWPCHNKF